MACRSYPADTRLQSFFAEGYERERDARMKYYLERKRGAGGAKDQSEVWKVLLTNCFSTLLNSI